MGSGCICLKQKNQVQARKSTIPPSLHFRKSIDDDASKLQIWDAILKEFYYFSDPLHHFRLHYPTKFMKLLLNGPPSKLRWELWKAEANFVLKPAPHLEINPEFLMLIEKDLERTFPHDPFFLEATTLSCLKESLIGTVSLNPELGYCQGMNYVAGILILVSNNNVPEVISMMDILIHKLNAKGLFEPGFPKVLELMEKFRTVFKTRLHTLHDHFTSIELDENLWLTKWFMTLFSYSFKATVVVRLWDLILATNLDFMVEISIEILSGIKKVLEKMDLQETLDFLHGLLNYNIDIEPIIAIILKKNSLDVPSAGSAWKETNADEGISESQFRLKWESFDVPSEQVVPAMNLAVLKRNSVISSLIIQHSPKLI